MTTTTRATRDYLDKALFVNRDIVTFRSLSRALRIHVNDAKKALQEYYDAVCDTDAPAVPTYLVSGEVPPLTLTRRSDAQQSQSQSSMDMDVDMDCEEEVDEVHQSKVLLVDARMLDDTVAQFSRVYAVHIYSLSPSRLGDAGLVCTPSCGVHQADARGGPEYCAVVGKVTGPHVKFRDGAHRSVASSSKTTLEATAKLAPKFAAKVEHQTTKGKAPLSETRREQGSTTTPLQRTESKERPKPSGKLDWSKAKAKPKERESVVEKTTEEKKPKPEPDSPISAIESTSKRKSLGPTKAPVAKSHAQKRGTIRKSLVDTDEESESSLAKAKPSTTGSSSVKRGVVYSDEDDEDDGEVRMLGVRRLKRKSTMTSDSEMSLRAMMDIDDEQVDRVSRANRAVALREESEESEEEVNVPEKEATIPPVTTEDEESDHVPVAPKKKKPRKVVPVGRNGLKKRRVVKSRTTTDAKGYIQTEDYSSYESVGEEEEEEEVKPKRKGKETKKAITEETKPKVMAKEEGSGKPKAKPGPKPRGGAAKRGGLLHFFGPDKGKK